MEEGLEAETPGRPKGAPGADKAGWIKKSTGGFLGLWKERYVLLSKARLLVYEDEDEQRCVETVELEGYDKCQDLRALLKRRNRFVLIRAPGYKVQDIKFQASSGEEKESWMKALSEGISRGKNKVLDEVKVDESLSLEHITRGRAKMGHGRRPPTRSHLKEVADAASDGLLRLDLVDEGSPKASLAASETENDLPPKDALQPPLPPSKALVPPAERQTGGSAAESPEGKKPPVESLSPVEEAGPGAGGAAGDGGGEEAVEAGRSTPQAPAPPPKVLSEASRVTVTWDGPSAEPEQLQDAAEEGGRPPTPPPKILSERLKASVSQAAPPERHPPAEGWEPPEQGLPGGPGPEPLPEDAAAQAGGGESGPAVPSLDLPARPRCASEGDLLLAEPRRRPLLAQVEAKVAAEQERTERLLRQVLQRGLGRAQGEAEALLSEAAAQLRQASRVLREVKALGALGKEPAGRREGVAKDLAALYRRSAP